MRAAPPASHQRISRACLFALLLASQVIESSASEKFEELLKPVLQSHCVQCHGQDGQVKGKVNLLEVESEKAMMGDPDFLELVMEVIDYEEMPPEDEKQIEAGKRVEIVEYLRERLHVALNSTEKVPHTPIRRMNRFQYNNAVVDLLELNAVVFPLPEKMMRDHSNYFKPASGKMPEKLRVGSRPLGKSQLIEERLAGVSAFPQDLRAEHGFDNRGDHLSLSPLLMEEFLKLSVSIMQSPDMTAKTSGVLKTLGAVPEDLPKKDRRKELRSMLRPILTKAFRHPVEKEVLDRYVSYAVRSMDSGVEFSAAIKEVVSAVLASPRFLYLFDRAEADAGAKEVDDFELASRLSFFLWGSIPDEELLVLAGKGRLSRPEILREQVDRMLADRKLKRFCDSFPAQWLQLDRIISAIPDRDTYEEFFMGQYRLSMHMMLEPLLLFETVLIEDRSILELIDPDFSYRTVRLQNWYGEEPIKEKASSPTVLTMYRVPTENRRQTGVITNAATMVMTSGPHETKPITRGAWILGVIFNDPPEPPPADVPPLNEKKEEVAHLTLRERFSAHRERADCKGCHEKLDPLGFAMENFNPVGKWRETYENGREVDASGTLFRKHDFTDANSFKDAVLLEKERFARALAEHLLSFALGRDLAAADSPSIDEIVKKTIDAGYRIQPLIHAIVASEAFRLKSSSKEQSIAGNSSGQAPDKP
ncbi:MAG: DUF1592 domain-containing protein [Verrucomicrobiota bacterium]